MTESDFQVVSLALVWVIRVKSLTLEWYRTFFHDELMLSLRLRMWVKVVVIYPEVLGLKSLTFFCYYHQM
jgi:hypothetical protein